MQAVSTTTSRKSPSVDDLFGSTRPLAFAGGDENLRRYVGNGATHATDPSGLFGDKLAQPVFGKYRGNTPISAVAMTSLTPNPSVSQPNWGHTAFGWQFCAVQQNAKSVTARIIVKVKDIELDDNVKTHDNTMLNRVDAGDIKFTSSKNVIEALIEYEIYTVKYTVDVAGAIMILEKVKGDSGTEIISIKAAPQWLVTRKNMRAYVDAAIPEPSWRIAETSGNAAILKKATPAKFMDLFIDKDQQVSGGEKR